MGRLALTFRKEASMTSGHTKMWTILFVLFIFAISRITGQEDLISVCRGPASRQSCGECIKQNPRCVWCTDPAFPGDYRCDVESNLIATCAPQFLYQAKSNVRVTENVEAGTYEPNHGKIRQIQPQQVHALIKPGETVTFPLKYYHVPQETNDIYILNSETESQGVSLAYSVDCKGIVQHDRACTGVRTSDLIVYNVSVTIRGCTSNAVVSIGLSGVREVVALYVHPQCGCDCENPERQEQRSNHCSGVGTLVCGACACDDHRKGGRHCECDLAPGQTTEQLEESCRQEPGKPLCNDHGYCSCGHCVCDPPSQYSGRFCECAFAACPVADTNGQTCGGRGNCYCGACVCDPGWTGPACTCSTETDDCFVDGKICSGGGTCLCNKCKCFDGYEGERCERTTGYVAPTPISPDSDSGATGHEDAHGGHAETPSPDQHGQVTEGASVEDNQPKPEPDVPEPPPETESHPEPEPESKPEPEPTDEGGDHDEDSDQDDADGENSPEPEPSADGQSAQSPESGSLKYAASNFLCLLAVIVLGLTNQR